MGRRAQGPPPRSRQAGERGLAQQPSPIGGDAVPLQQRQVRAHRGANEAQRLDVRGASTNEGNVIDAHCEANKIV